MNLASVGLVLILGYAAILLIGGVVGYLQAKSIKSLGLSSAIALMLVGAAALDWVRPREGLAVATVISLGMVAVFSKRYQMTKAMVPAGVLLGVNVLFSLALFYSWWLLKPSPVTPS
jgi:uncharacterized membrane protein (UPF0136 family)